MSARWTELRFGRRLLTLFVTSALLPIGATFLLSWFQVTDQLRDQSQQRLQQASKAVGLALLGQLQRLDGELASLDPEGERRAWREDGLRRDFSSIVFLPARGEPRMLLGAASPAPAVDPEARRALSRGEPLLRSDARGELWIVRRAAGGRDPQGLIAAIVNRDAIFDLSASSVVPPSADFCVFDGERRLLACSADAVPPVEILSRDGGAGAFEWSAAGEDYLAHAFLLFLGASFRAPNWHVVLSEPRSAVLAPMIAFRRALPLVALLSVVVITLLCIRQIRARLVPFQALQEGTRRIAQRDFAVELRIESGDEFEELAGSFNTMAHRLQSQFRSLTHLVEIDRSILEATEEQGVFEAVARRLPDVYPCEAVALLPHPYEALEGSVEAHEGTAWVCRVDTAEVRRAVVPRHLPETPETPEAGRLVTPVAGDPQLAPLWALGMASVVLLPMTVQGEEIGRLALGHAEPLDAIPEEIVYARRVTDQASIAVRSIRVNEENRMLAYYDSLTGLPNRLLFRERVEQALVRAKRKGTKAAIFMLDLDGFKRVNDTWGHEAGDRLLEAVAQRILPLIRAGTLARLGGDEFSLLLAELAHGEDAARVADRIVLAMQEPFSLGEREVFITTSIGIAVYPEDGTSLGSLLKHADVAMYHAKDLGRNNFQYFAIGLNEAAARRMELEQALRGALEAGQLRLVYQPILDPVSRRIEGLEALLRWQHPELGAVPPAVFIPVAEETGLIVSIGEWVLDAALAEAAAWQRSGSTAYVTVNISERQFRSEDTPAMIRQALRRAGLGRDRLVLELTESMLMAGERQALRQLAEIRMLGVGLAIDDFGTGYSSFAYLKEFPVQILKLDKQFIQELETSPESRAITDAMVMLGHKLGLQVIAEGVETDAQLALLLELGCDLVQGTLLSGPLEAEALRELLRAPGSLSLGPRSADG